MRKLLLFFIFLILSTSLIYSVSADSHLPIGILKAQQYNQNLALQMMQSVSILIAFMAGLTSIVSPCVLPLFPAYFAITFKERKRITLATSLFFVGFSSVFVVMGLIATMLGKTFATLFTNTSWIVTIAGVFFILFGTMIFLGKGFAGMNIHKRFSQDWKGLILSGGFFAIGWSACIGPILSGVLIMGGTFQNYGTSAILMVFYSLGIFVPLFILSFFYDKIKIQNMWLLNKKFTFEFFKKKFYTNLPNVLAGVIFVLLGVVFIIFKGTANINKWDFFGLQQKFYEWQDFFLLNTTLFNVIGVIILITFIGVLYHFIRKELKENRKRLREEK